MLPLNNIVRHWTILFKGNMYTGLYYLKATCTLDYMEVVTKQLLYDKFLQKDVGRNVFDLIVPLF
jgi:hypothetical protein